MEPVVHCVKGCGREAEYEIPEDLCEDHWIDWWVEGMRPRTPEERAQLVEEVREEIRRDPVKSLGGDATW
jgi:hypothetical protein